MLCHRGLHGVLCCFTEDEVLSITPYVIVVWAGCSRCSAVLSTPFSPNQLWPTLMGRDDYLPEYFLMLFRWRPRPFGSHATMISSSFYIFALFIKEGVALEAGSWGVRVRVHYKDEHGLRRRCITASLAMCQADQEYN